MKKTEKDLTISMAKANVLGTLIGIFVILLFAGIFGLIYNRNFLNSANWEFRRILFTDSPLISGIGIIGLLFLLVFIHEVLHCVGCWRDPDIGFKDSVIRFNFKTLSPYFHCSKPIMVNTYRFAVFLPTLVLGIIPIIVGLVYGVSILMFYGSIMLASSGGDWMILWLLRKENKKHLVLDHPTRCGCIVYT